MVIAIVALAIVAVVAIVALIISRLPPVTPTTQSTAAAVGVCPRYEAVGKQPAPGQEIYHLRDLRRRAFGGDFFAQIDLGQAYEGDRSTDDSKRDHLESAVWYAVALANRSGLPAGGRIFITPPAKPSGWFGAPAPAAPVAQLECRDVERHHAYDELDWELSTMPAADRDRVRDRVVYILSQQGPTGLLELGQLYDDAYGAFSEKRGDVGAWGESYRFAGGLFPNSDPDAWLYYYLAKQTLDPAALEAFARFVGSTPERGHLSDRLQAAAERWRPPFEIYPPEKPLNAPLPYSDESRWNESPDSPTLSAMAAVPFIHVGRALAYLNLSPYAPPALSSTSEGSIAGLHAELGAPDKAADKLTMLDRVRAIQLAAVRGSPDAELLLAVMYAEGVGVNRDYARAYFWFDQAEQHGSAPAAGAMAIFHQLGLGETAPKSASEAVVLRIRAALGGYGPSVDTFETLLDAYSAKPAGGAK